MLQRFLQTLFYFLSFTASSTGKPSTLREVYLKHSLHRHPGAKCRQNCWQRSGRRLFYESKHFSPTCCVERNSRLSPWCRRAWRCDAACGTAAWRRPPPEGSWTPRPGPSRSAWRSRSGTSLAGKSLGLRETQKYLQFSHNSSFFFFPLCTSVCVWCKRDASVSTWGNVFGFNIKNVWLWVILLYVWSFHLSEWNKLPNVQ